MVFVLDSAPEDLVRLVGYLEDMTDAGLLIDLVTVSEYEAGPSRILVPQRIDPVRSADRRAPETVATRSPDATPIQGVSAFISSISDAAPSARSALLELSEWATALERDGLARLYTTIGSSGRTRLIPRISGYDAGFVTIVIQPKGPALWLWRSVIKKHSPAALPALEAAYGQPIGRGSTWSTYDQKDLFTIRLLRRSREV